MVISPDSTSSVGTIRSITLQNWMSYTGPVTLYPSSGLNIIAASNGSGKSALVCAIALGLGYPPTVISRGDSTSAFVKRGYTWAKIEICINTNKGSVSLARRIEIQGNSSSTTWQIDGRRATSALVSETVSSLNIHLDNLITFLPQENVGRFASMTPKQLLSATLGGLNPNLLEGQKEIVQMDKDAESLNGKIKTGLKEVSLLKGEIELLERRERELQQLELERLRLSKLNYMLVLLNLEDLTLKIDENHKKIEECEAEIVSLRSRIGPLNTLKDKMLETKEKYDNEVTELTSVIKTTIDKLKGPSDLFSSKMHFEAYNLVKIVKTKLAADEAKRQEMRRRLDELSRIDAENRQEMELLRVKVAESEKKFNAISSKLAEKKVELEMTRINTPQFTGQSYNREKYPKGTSKAKRAKLEDEKLAFNNISFDKISYKEMQLDNLYKTMRPRSVSDMSRFLRVKDKYPQVLGPIASLIELTSPYASILESVLKNYLDAFIAPNTPEMIELLKSEYNISIITTPNKEIPLCYVTDKIKSWGVGLFLHEAFNAPMQVKMTLANVARVNQSFIVTDSSKLNDNTFSEFYNLMIGEISQQVGKRVKTLEYFMDGMRRIFTIFGNSTLGASLGASLGANASTTLKDTSLNATNSINASINAFSDEQTPYIQNRILIQPGMESNSLHAEIEMLEKELENADYGLENAKLQRLEIVSERVAKEAPKLASRLDKLPKIIPRKEILNQYEKGREMVRKDIAEHLNRISNSIKETSELVPTLSQFGQLVSKTSYLNKLLQQLEARLDPLTLRLITCDTLLNKLNKMQSEYNNEKTQLQEQSNELKKKFDERNKFDERSTDESNSREKATNERATNERATNERATNERATNEQIDSFDEAAGYRMDREELVRQIQVAKVRIEHLSSMVGVFVNNNNNNSSNEQNATNDSNSREKASNEKLLSCTKASNVENPIGEITCNARESVSVDDYASMDLLESRRAKMRQMLDDVSEYEKERADLLKIREERVIQWSKQVNEIIERIDMEFSRMLGMVNKGVAGRVFLSNPSNPGDSEILIKVRFKEGKDLVPLAASYQSGGERGVVTMLYILALQNSAFSPFVLLDEINQGLDADYERALIRIVQENLDKNSQIFVITPHLIPGLDLTKATLHFPFNGPFIPNDVNGWMMNGTN